MATAPHDFWGEVGGRQAWNTLVEIQYVDSYDLTRLGREVHGQAPIARFERLIEDLPAQADTTVSWAVRGMQDAGGRSFLQVAVKAAPQLRSEGRPVGKECVS